MKHNNTARVYRPDRRLFSPQFAFLFFFFIQIIGINGYGQTVDSNFVDGQVYIRIKGQLNQIPPYEIGDSLSNYPIPIQTIIGNYQVEKIKKAFNLRSDTTVDYIYRVIFSDIANIGSLLNDFNALQFVDFAERVPLYKVNCTNEAMGYWNVGNPANYHLNLINACNAFPLLTIGNQPVRVAVVDNEFDVNHPDLVNKFNATLCWDVSDNDPNVDGPPSYNHGTHCAGIIAAENNNNLGVASLGGGWGTINPIEVMGIKATPSSLPTGNSLMDGFTGIDWAANNGARIISCSWGTQTASTNSVMATAEQLALNQTLNNHPNVIVVFAAGNSNIINNAFPAAANAITAPSISQANLDRMLSVASVDALSAKSFFSNYGPTIDICAPGTNIFSPIHDGNYQFSSGTSMAAPMVASLLALVAYNNPAFTAQQIIDCVTNSASNIDNMNPNFLGQLGAGLINAPDALTCAPSNNITFALNDNTFCVNNAQNITVTIGGLPQGVTVNSIQWNLPGSNLGTATGATVNSLSYAQFGIFPVTLTCILSNANTVIFQTSFLCLGDMQLVPTSSMPICANSMQQISVVDAASLFVYSSFIANPAFNPVPLNLTNNFNGTHQSYFQITGNQTVNLPQVTYIFQNNSFNQMCLLNDNSIQYNPMCCELNMVQNGDFSLGNTAFTTNAIFHTNCNGPGTYTIEAANTQPIGFSNGDILYYDAPYDYTNFVTLPPSNCVPFTPVLFAPPAPVDVRMHTQLGLTFAAWQQPFMMTNSHDYKFSFLSKHGHSNLIFPFRVRVRITNGTNNVFTSPVLTPFQATNQWTLNDILIQNFSGATGMYDVVLEQIDNYGDMGFDLYIDDLGLQIIYPLTITSSNSNICLSTGTTNVLTATIPSSGITSYFWTGPNGGILGSNSGQSVTVGLPGVYTLNAINASPLAVNCANLSSTFVVNGTAITAAVNYSNCLGTITTNIVSTTGTNFSYALNGGTPQLSNIFAGLPAGTYTVVATDNNGCTGSVIVTLNPNSSISAFASPTAVCIGSSSLLTASGSNSYIWQPGNLSGSSVSVSPTSTTIYTVTGTNSSGCTSLSQVTVNVLNSGLICCNPNSTLPVSHIFPPNTTATQVLAWYNNGNGLPLSNSVIDLTNNPVGNVSKIYFEGGFDVNTNIHFLNCDDVFFAPDALIQIAANTLTIEKSAFKAACNTMWKGIQNMTSTSKIVALNSSTLMQMKDGLKIPFGELFVDDCKFYDNYISIQLANVSGNFGHIQSSIFKTLSNSLLAPYASQSNGQHGIIIDNCTNINIGHPSIAAQGNVFDNLRNGIYIRNTSNLSPNNIITTSFNTFKNITGTSAIWDPLNSGVSISQNPLGCAIYALSTSSINSPTLKHFGYNNASITDIFNCQKGFVCNNFHTIIQNNRMLNTEGGMMLFSAGHTNLIRSNTLDNTCLGISISGASWGGIKDNTLNNIKPAYQLSGNPNTQYIYWGKGIVWQQPSIVASGLKIKNNTITTPATDFFIGIDALNLSKANMEGNTIAMSSLSNASSLSTVQNMIGVSLNRCSGVELFSTSVTGTNQLSVQDVRRTAGLYMQKSPNNFLHCNIFDNLQYGMVIQGNCIGYNLYNNQLNAGVEQNRVTTTRFGWLFRHLTTNGTVGDIGQQGIYDANNKFYPPSGSNKKVHRVFNPGYVCNPTAPQPTIYTNTNNIQINDSYSNISGNGCRYGVENFNPGTPVICSPAINIAPSTSGGIDEEYAEDIAQDEVEYTEFPEGGEYFDERALFAYLVQDSLRRVAYPVLNTFYINRQGSTLEQLAVIDQLLSRLSDSTTREDLTLFENLLAEAKQLNSVVSTIELFDLNEHHINALHLKDLEYGSESLTLADLQWISNLAQECPYVAGNAVYKARSMYVAVDPLAYFDDLVICNNVGVYKGGNSLFDAENAALDSMSAQDGLQLIYALEGDRITLYPNPANDQVTVSYKLNALSTGTLQILDIHGRVLQTITLSPTKTKFSFSVRELPNAVYTYRFLVNNMPLQHGKFVKE